MEETQPLPPRELKGRRKFGYSMGDLGMSLPNIFTGVFLFQYYVYTINLDSVLVSVGVTTQLIVSAFFAIIFGVIVDNKKPGKLGKRRPFLLIGLPIWFITTILTWFPPRGDPGIPAGLSTAIYFWVIILIRSISRSLLFNVYISMLPEQSQTSKNRESVASIRSAFAIISSVVALMMPLIIQSLLEDPKNAKWWTASGQIVLFYIPIIGICFAIFGFVSVLLIYFSVDETFHNNSDIGYKREKISLIGRFRQMSLPARDNNYRNIVIAGFFSGIAGKLLGLLVFPFQTYVLEFSSAQFFIYILISIFGKFGWYFVWMKLRKRNHILKSYSVVMLLGISGSFLGMFFFIRILAFNIQLVLYIITWSTVLGSMYSFPLFSIPITAALVQEAAENSEEKNVDIALSKISGAYYGLSSFIRSLGPASASLIVGFILSGVNKENPILLILLWCFIGVFYLIALIFIRRIKIKHISFFDHQVLEEVIEEIEED
ncbi:MAG: MFS transporter [Promethearchaeota archaeon]|jgi:Na+/melibiose symporter-like transporter